MSYAVAERKTKTEKVEDRTGRKTAPVQVAKDLARMAAVVASHDGITQADLISPLLRPFLTAEYKRVQEQIQQELAQKRRE